MPENEFYSFGANRPARQQSPTRQTADEQEFARYAQAEAQARNAREAEFRRAYAAATTDAERHRLAADHGAATRAETAEGIDRELRDMDDEALKYLASYGARGLNFDALTMAERKALRARNELARRQHIATKQQAEAAKAAELQARQQAEAAKQQAEARRLLRAGFVGTDAEFEEAFPGLWKRLRDRQALDAANAAQQQLTTRRTFSF